MSRADRAGGRGGGRRGDPPPPPEPLSVPAVDSHCHLDLMDVPVEDALAAAAAVGIRRVVTVGIDASTSRWCADVAAAHEHVVATVAIHPNEAPTAADDDFAVIAELAERPEVRGIGETGLDYYRTGEDGRPRQEASFRRHIELSKRTGKALVIHDRDAHPDVLRVLDDVGAPEHVVLHCFSGDGDFATECVSRGYVLSFAGNVTFANAAHLREAATRTPPDQLLVETDAPFLTPMPYRGRPNAPYLIPLTLRALAEVKGMAVDDLAGAVDATATRVFGAF